MKSLIALLKHLVPLPVISTSLRSYFIHVQDQAYMWPPPPPLSSVTGSIGYHWQRLSPLGMNVKGPECPRIIASWTPAPPASGLCAVLWNKYPHTWFIHFLNSLLL